MAGIRFIGGLNASEIGTPVQATGTGGGTLTFTDDTDKGQAVGGYIKGAGTAYSKAKSTAYGSQAFGYANAPSSSIAGLYAESAGCMIGGAGVGADANAIPRSKSKGGFVHGYVTGNQGGAYPDYPYLAVMGNSQGSVVIGAIQITDAGTTSYGDLRTQEQGCFVGGFAYSASTASYMGPYHVAQNGAFGAFLWGTEMSAGGYHGAAYGAGEGSMTFGYRKATATAVAYMKWGGRGNLLFGYALGSNMYGTAARGGFTGGWADENNITVGASANGALAFGRSDTGVISTNANSAFQFGPGTNDEPDSLQIGSTIRLNGALAAPGSNLHNGDMWVASNYVYVRSNGVSVKIV